MEKIVIDYVYKNYFSARSKAREDVNIIAKNHGFTPFLINTRTTTEQAQSNPSAIKRLFYNIRKLFIFIRSVATIKRGTLVLLQYPLSPFGDMFTSIFCSCLKRKKCHLVLLVHDITHVRATGEKFDSTEVKIFNTASELILHTPQMQKLMKENGVDRPSRLLWLFDYLTDETPSQDRNPDNADLVAYAGSRGINSMFMRKLTEVPYKGIELHLYGREPLDIEVYPDWLKYIGRFDPDNVTKLTEGWGLTWDGDGIDALRGPLGNYVKYNSPHKVSLYIAAGIPVIVSKESALADFVEENKLGIAIPSLLELDKSVVEFDKEELQTIRKHVDEMSVVLRTGGRLGALLDSIVEEKGRATC